MSPGPHVGKKLGAFGVVVALGVAACTSGPAASTTTVTTQSTTTAAADECAHVVAATLERAASGFRVMATVRSGDTGWDKYADAWEVRDEDGAVLGTRILAHPHVDEQPFTRSLDGVDIPDGIVIVEIAARDSVNGFCGETLHLEVPQE